MIGGLSNTGVPAESIFGGVKGAAVRQMSGGTSRRRVRQARAATQWGRKARMGLPAKCTFCGVPGRRGYNTPMWRDGKFNEKPVLSDVANTSKKSALPRSFRHINLLLCANQSLHFICARASSRVISPALQLIIVFTSASFSL